MDLSVIWFRRDLRLQDNEAVAKAASSGTPCLYVFVLDPWFLAQLEIGWLRVRFLFESLAALDEVLRKSGNRLIILRGESVMALTRLLDTLHSHKYRSKLYYNHDIQVEYGRRRDTAVEEYCRSNNVPIESTYNYFLLHEERDMDTWWRSYYDYQYAEQYALPVVSPSNPALSRILRVLPQLEPARLAQELRLSLPQPRQILFSGGEQAARQAVYSFLKDRVDGYRWKISRPHLAQRGATSLLGPHLAFGTISNRTVFQAAVRHRAKLERRKPKKAFDIATYLDRLRWRDSFTQRLWFHPELIWQNRFPEFDSLYTQDALQGLQQEYFERWQSGETGFPLLDAAMRQLKHDGFINFRMRAMAATFLTINCGISWHHGARHFMNYLVDGDIAINHWQWQMQAGVTNPLSPTFRMYNPSKNLQERDPTAAYVHFWLPETAGQDVPLILKNARPMLDFAATRRQNGQIVSDIRKSIRQRLLNEKGLELEHANAAHRTVTKYHEHSVRRYEAYKQQM